MKKFYKILTAALAAAIIMASPVGTLTARAEGAGFEAGNEGKDAGSGAEAGGAGDQAMQDFMNSLQQQEQAPAPEPAPAPAPAPAPDPAPAPAPSQPAPTPSVEENSSNTGSTQSGSTQNKSNKSKEDLNDVAMSVEGGEEFHSVMNEDHTRFDVVHDASGVASFDVTDAEGDKVKLGTLELVQGEDGLWYLNIIFAEGIDAEGLVLNLLEGDLEYLETELGITGIQINGKVVMLTNPKRVPIEDIPIGNADVLSAFEKAGEKARNANYLVVRGGSTSYTDVANK